MKSLINEKEIRRISEEKRKERLEAAKLKRKAATKRTTASKQTTTVKRTRTVKKAETVS